jgi:hypothetical protein
LCDDANECTDDLCAPASGCVHANLTGPACEDGDLCTVTGGCKNGVCIATDGSYGQKVKLKAKFKDGPSNDRVTLKMELPLSQFSSDPIATGLLVELRDTADQNVYFGEIPAGAFEDTKGTGESFKFRDSKGEIPLANGIQSAQVRIVTKKSIAKAKVKIKDVEVPGIAAQPLMTASLLFGADPALDDCLTARRVPCMPKPTSNSCKD